MIDCIMPFEQMEFRLFRKLANCLRISFSELVDLAPTLTPVFVMENFISGYTLSFGPNAPARTLKKIKGLSGDKTIYLRFYLVNDLLTMMGMTN